MEISFTNDGIIGILFVLGFTVIVYFIIREIRLMKTNNRRFELELEREKLNLMSKDSGEKYPAMMRLREEQLDSLRSLEDSNVLLETDIYAKQKLVEGRIQKLESLIKSEKLDKILAKIQDEEKRLG